MNSRWSDLYLGILMILGTFLLAVGMIALGAFLFMWAWNYVMPVVFHLPQLNFLQALCLHYLGRTCFTKFEGVKVGKQEGNSIVGSTGS